MPDLHETLSLLATDLLTAAADAWVGNPGGHETPSDRYVVHRAGGPAWDGCDALTVHVEGIRAGHGSARIPSTAVCHIVPVVDLAVTLLRCGAPMPREGGDPPTPTTIYAHAESMLEDGWILYAELLQAWSTGDLFPSFSDLGCAHVVFESLVPLGPRAEIAGWRIPLAVTLTAAAD